MQSIRNTQVTTRKHGQSGGEYYTATVWGERPHPLASRPVLGGGIGGTRREAIKEAKLDAAAFMQERTK